MQNNAYHARAYPFVDFILPGELKCNTRIDELSPFNQEKVDAYREDDNESVNTFSCKYDIMVYSLPQYNSNNEFLYKEKIVHGKGDGIMAQFMVLSKLASGALVHGFAKVIFKLLKKRMRKEKNKNCNFKGWMFTKLD